MTEEIIIDGVDVAGCKYYIQDYQRANNIEGRYEHCKDVCELNGDNYFYCKMNNDCYYKQLKRLEFELKVTKADYEASEQENKELKEEIQILNKDSYTRLREMTVLDAELDEVGVMNNNYRYALEEIRKIADKCKECLNEDDDCGCDYLRIVRKINEVLDE